MLKSILNLSEVSLISKKNQSTIQGGSGAIGFDCLAEPPECFEFEILMNCVCHREGF